MSCLLNQINHQALSYFGDVGRQQGDRLEKKKTDKKEEVPIIGSQTGRRSSEVAHNYEPSQPVRYDVSVPTGYLLTEYYVDFYF